VRIVAALIALTIAGGSVAETPLVRAGTSCSGPWNDACAEAEIKDGALEITGQRPGGAGGPGESTVVPDLVGREELAEDLGDGIRCDDALGRCGHYEVVSRPEPTLEDVVSFTPSLAPLTAEPAGIGIAGLPVNLVARASSHTQRGELFDLPVTVRFRPVSFRFDYGDGTSRALDTGGRTWSSLGAPQFTSTATSHIYTERSTYTVRASVSFRVDVDFGNGWERVPGALALPVGDAQIEILAAHTALVERTCGEDPRGIGC